MMSPNWDPQGQDDPKNLLTNHRECQMTVTTFSDHLVRDDTLSRRKSSTLPTRSRVPADNVTSFIAFNSFVFLWFDTFGKSDATPRRERKAVLK
jgi:hypothetical protein